MVKAHSNIVARVTSAEPAGPEPAAWLRMEAHLQGGPAFGRDRDGGQGSEAGGHAMGGVGAFRQAFDDLAGGLGRAMTGDGTST